MYCQQCMFNSSNTFVCERIPLYIYLPVYGLTFLMRLIHLHGHFGSGNYCVTVQNLLFSICHMAFNFFENWWEDVTRCRKEQGVPCCQRQQSEPKYKSGSKAACFTAVFNICHWANYLQSFWEGVCLSFWIYSVVICFYLCHNLSAVF